MEKYQLERREKIAAGIVLASAGLVALWARKEDRIGVARRYPGGAFFIDIIKDARDEASVRIAFVLKRLNPPEIDFEGVENTDAELDVVEETFDTVLRNE